MATETATASFLFDKVTPDTLKLTSGTNTYVLEHGAGGSFKIALQGSNKALKAKELDSVAKQFAIAFEDFAGKEGLEDGQIGLVQKTFAAVKKTHPTAVTNAESAFMETKALEGVLKNVGRTATPSQLRAIEDILIAEPHAERLLDVTHLHILQDAEKVNMESVTRTVSRVRGFATQAETLLTSGNFDADKIKGLLIDHGSDAFGRMPQADQAKLIAGFGKRSKTAGSVSVNLTSLVDEVSHHSKTLEATVGTRLSEIARLQTEALAHKGLLSNSGKLKEVEEAVDSLTKLVNQPENTAYKAYVSRIIDSHPEKDVLVEAGAMKGLVADVGKAAESSPLTKAMASAGKDGKATQGFLAKLINKSI